MTQASLVVANGGGSSVRAAINAALMALATNNTGSTTPTTTYGAMFWADTSSGTLWRRKSDNSAWLSMGALDLSTPSQAQLQSGTAFTAAGTAPAYTLTPSPAIQVYASPQRFNVTFPAAGTTGSNTINVSGLGAIPLKQFAADGSLVSGIVTAGMNSDVQIVGAGSYALLLDPLPSLAGGNLTAPLNANRGTALASAATVNIGAATGEYLHITGTTTITAFDTVQAGTERTVVFDGILTLTYNATSMMLPTAANITTAAGDTAKFRSEGGGNWKCISYQRADGSVLAGNRIQFVTAVATTSGTAIDFTGIPSWAKRITITLDGVSPTGTDSLLVQIGSSSGGIESASYYSASVTVAVGYSPSAVSSTAGFIVRAATASALMTGDMVLTLQSGNKWIESHHCGDESTPTSVSGSGKKTLSATLDRVRLTWTGTNTFDAGNANIVIEG